MTTDTFSPNSTISATTQRVRYSRLWWVGLLAIALATVANLLVRAIALPFITVPPEFIPVSSAIPTIVFTVGGVLAAVIVFAIVGRFSRQPARAFTLIAVVALLLSLVPNVMMLVDPANAPFPGGNAGSMSVLMIQHVVAAAVAVWVFVTQAVETRA